MKLRIGTRRSPLALAQAEEVRERLMILGAEAELVPMVTSGDRGVSAASAPGGLKGLFVSEIVRALRDGEVDLAVHSAKDLPAEDEEGVAIAAVPERASPLDVLVTRDGQLPHGGVVGTSSLRRRAQILRWRSDVRVAELRGNLDTRLRRLEEGTVDGVLVAAAGLLRLGVTPAHCAPMSIAEMVPAPGQGCLAVQARSEDRSTLDLVSALDHADSRSALWAERALTRRLGGGCALPLGAHAWIEHGRVRLVAIVASPDGKRFLRIETEAPSPDAAAEEAARNLLQRGASEILAAVRG
ncbi:MAG TPA: hydroxymethylbilane synthase [Actinomycetota bacterium]|nr:hydroxymethylbilane synthase [Actinomycetota bacterium]